MRSLTIFMRLPNRLLSCGLESGCFHLSRFCLYIIVLAATSMIRAAQAT